MVDGMLGDLFDHPSWLSFVGFRVSSTWIDGSMEMLQSWVSVRWNTASLSMNIYIVLLSVAMLSSISLLLFPRTFWRDK
jgi:hypothetical protein